MVGGLREQQHLLGDGISIPCCRQVSEDLIGFPFCTYDKQTIECHMTPPPAAFAPMFWLFLRLPRRKWQLGVLFACKCWFIEVLNSPWDVLRPF